MSLLSLLIFQADKDEVLSYEDRTTRFFPPAPVMPRIGGLSSGDTGIVDENEEAIPEFCSASCQRFNILCSGGKDGYVCFSIFGIFPVGRIVSKCNNSLLVNNLNSIKLILVHGFSLFQCFLLLVPETFVP